MQPPFSCTPQTLDRVESALSEARLKRYMRDAEGDKANRFRIHRNRLAHHKPVYDRSPTAEHLNILDLSSWVCGEPHWLVKQWTPMTRRIGERPRS